MLAMSKVLNLKIHQSDVDNAFPYADLDEEVYMAPPPLVWICRRVTV